MSDISELDVPIFRRLSADRLAEVGRELERRTLAAGQILFNQGEPGEELFIVQDGCVAIFAPGDGPPGQENALRLFGAGDVLGEMAVIDHQPRSLSARAVEPTRLLVWRGDSFCRLVEQDPEMSLAVMGGLNDRIRYTTEFLNQVRHWVGRMSAGKYRSEQFVHEMEEWVRQVTGGDAAGGPGGVTVRYHDEMLATLAAQFAQMATQVREREEALRRQVEQLRIEIDVARKQRQVSEIVDTEFFQSLKERAATLRRRRDDDETG